MMRTACSDPPSKIVMNGPDDPIRVLFCQPRVGSLTGDMWDPSMATRFPLRGPTLQNKAFKQGGGGRSDLPRLDDGGPFVTLDLRGKPIHTSVKSGKVESMSAKKLIYFTSDPILISVRPFYGHGVSLTDGFLGDKDKVLPNVNKQFDMASDILPSCLTLLSIELLPSGSAGTRHASEQ